MKILVLGSKGQLGRCLYDQLLSSHYEVIYTSREQIDIANFEATKIAIFKIVPDVIVNATAYTAVDKAEQDPDQAKLINHLAVANIAQICHRLNSWLIHVSTDYVFDGNSEIPYKEKDQTNPQGVYGETKLKGELAIQSSSCKYLIIRTAWVFSEYGNNFLKTMLRLGSERDELSIIDDQIGCPTYAQDIARTIIGILPQLNKIGVEGIYHYCGDQQCSWYDFAKFIFKIASTQGKKTPKLIRAIKTSEHPSPAKRPQYSVLDCKRISSSFGVTPSNWKKGISYVLDKI